MIAALAIVFLAAHLLAINVASAGPLVWAWLVHGSADQPLRAKLALRMAWRSLTGLGVGIALGTALLAAPNPALRAALGRFPASTYWFAGAELLFSAVWMAAAILPVRPNLAHRPWLAWLLALVTSSNLLYHFPPMMSVIGKLASNPAWATDPTIDHRTMMQLAARPDVLALWVHFVLASIAASAIVALWPGRDATPSASDVASSDDKTSRKLAGIALVATLLQLPVGAWVLLATDGSARGALMGNDAIASGLLLGGVAAALALTHTLGAISMGETEPAMRRRAAWSLAAVAVLMSATLNTSRRTGDRAANSAGQAPTSRPTLTSLPAAPS